jgi:cell division initiation protein
MAITARDIHEKEFGHGMRGYKESEVDDFLDQCAAEVDRLTRENKALKTQLEQSRRAAASPSAPVVVSTEQAPVVEAPRVESSEIGDVLLLAKSTADDLIKKARSQADKIVGAAEERASEIVGGAATKKRDILNTAKTLKQAETDFRNDYRALLERSLRDIKEIFLDIDIEEEVAASKPRKAAKVAPVAPAAEPVAEKVEEVKVKEPVVVDPGILDSASFVEQVEFDDDLDIAEID